MTDPITFASKPTLTGKLVALRPVREADVAGLATVDAETLRLTGSQPTFELEELRS
ncbi:MAG: hypothetical protein ACYDAQ_11125 [Mycobacteriales bacterium]